LIFLPAVPTAAFFAPFDPGRRGVGTRSISGQHLGDAGGRGAKRAPKATFYSLPGARLFSLINRFAASVKFTEGLYSTKGKMQFATGLLTEVNSRGCVY
jgi:hypothetical protein